MKRGSKGYTGVDIPLFPTMIVQGPIFQGEGSTVPVESHHTPTNAPSTSPLHLSSPPRSLSDKKLRRTRPRNLSFLSDRLLGGDERCGGEVDGALVGV
nr:hypothetical protein [Tanacetum cinerariifolium]